MNPYKKPVFVTGGTGLLGSHLIFSLVSKGHKVRAIYRKQSNREIIVKVAGYYGEINEEALSSIEWIECDMGNYECLKNTMDGTGFVYHCAAAVSFASSDKDKLISNNVQGTKNVVRACIDAKIEKLCHVSSTSALGASEGDFMVREDNVWDENDYHSTYGISKHLSEEQVWKGIENGLCAVIVNPSIILGPGDWDRSSAALFSKIDQGMLFHTDGMTGYVDVNDVVKAMIILTESKIDSERFIINSENISFGELFRMIARNLGVREPVIKVPKAMKRLLSPIVGFAEKVTGNRIQLTREMLNTAWSKVTFDNSKIVERTGIEFTPVKKSIESFAAIYKSEKRKEKRVQVL
jgi:dihydroflavonol-4-reductase